MTDMMGNLEGAILKYGPQEPLTHPSPKNMFGTNSYLKGAWVLHMLHQELGDETFKRAVREYYRRFAGSNAATADFQSVVEGVSGKSLKPFFQQWVFTPGNPRLSLAWVEQPSGAGNEVTVQVCQLQEGATYTIPLEIRLVSPSGESAQELIQVDERQERVTFPFPFDPSDLAADPEQNVLVRVEVGKVDTLVACGQ